MVARDWTAFCCDWSCGPSVKTKNVFESWRPPPSGKTKVGAVYEQRPGIAMPSLYDTTATITDAFFCLTKISNAYL